MSFGGGDAEMDAVIQRMVLESFLGSALRQRMGNSLQGRGNIPSPMEEDMILAPSSTRPDKLWIVDRILEPQTLPHFFEAVCQRKFPNGEDCHIPGPTVEEMILSSEPFMDWAPAPYNALEGKTMDRLMARIASFEFETNLLNISKTLHAMKSRLWEGIMPLSNRQWVEKGLDKPENFKEACQYISWVIKVFQYLNHSIVAAKMRDTFNSIHDDLKNFEDAINARRRMNGGEPNVQLRAIWTAYIRAHFDFITRRAHSWVLDRVNRLRLPVLEDLRNYVNPDPSGLDERMWELTNKIHDLGENSALADINIILPMQGYNGVATFDDSAYRGGPPPSSPLPGAHPDPRRRTECYHLRLRYLTRLEQHGGDTSREAFHRMVPTIDPSASSDALRTIQGQIRAQAQSRLEMRGEEPPPAQFWMSELRRRMKHPNGPKWGYVGYRTCHQCSDEEWQEFKRKFDADQKNWGIELGDIQDIREISQVHWLDTKELGINGEDPEAVKKHFKEFIKTDGAPSSVYDDLYLVADQPSIESYLKPVPEQGGFILAIDVDHDPKEPPDTNRAEESPGYDGTLRVLTSLLWDDINPMILLQTHHLWDLWPVAMHHPLHVYTGPVMPASQKKWEAMARARKILFASADKWRELCGVGDGTAQ